MDTKSIHRAQGSKALRVRKAVAAPVEQKPKAKKKSKKKDED
jgi:hypothetical protein